ncbi:MAG: hypothetical protein ACOYIB_05210, partial [Desulfosporosinus sp.]
KETLSVLKEPVLEREALSVLEKLVSEKEALPLLTIPLSGGEGQAVLKISSGASRIAEKIYTRIMGIMAGKQVPETNQIASFRYGLSGKINTQDMGANIRGNGLELVMPLQPSEAENYTLGHAKDMPLNTFITPITFTTLITSPTPIKFITPITFKMPIMSAIPITFTESAVPILQKNGKQGVEMDKQEWVVRTQNTALDFLIQLTDDKLGRRSEKRERQLKGSGPMSLPSAGPTAGLAYQGVAPGSVRSIFKPIFQARGSQLVDKLIRNVYKVLTEKQLERYIVFQEKFERALETILEKNNFYFESTKNIQENSGLRYATSFKSKLVERENLYEAKKLRVIEKVAWPVLKAPVSERETLSVLKAPVSGKETLSVLKEPVLEREALSVLEKPVSEKEALPLLTIPLSGGEGQAVLKISSGASRIAEKIYTRIMGIMAGKQVPETNQIASFRYGLSGKINTQDMGANIRGNGLELVMPLQPSEAENYTLGHAKDMPLNTFITPITFTTLITSPTPIKFITPITFKMPIMSAIPITFTESAVPILQKNGKQGVEMDKQEWVVRTQNTALDFLIQLTDDKLGRRSEKRERQLKGSGPMSLPSAGPTAGLAYQGVAPGSVRSIFKPIFQARGSQLVDKLIRVYKVLTEKQLERYIVFQEKFERAIGRNPFFNQAEKEKNNLIESYASFKSELAEIKKLFEFNISGIVGKDLSPLLKMPAASTEYLSVFNTPGSSKLWRIAEKVYTSIIELKNKLEVRMKEYPRVLERGNQTQFRRNQSTLTNVHQEAIIKRIKEKQLVFKELQNNEHLVLSGKIKYQDKGSNPLELVIPTLTSATMANSPGYTKNMPPILHKSSEQGAEKPKQRELVVKSLNMLTNSQTNKIKKSFNDVDFMSSTELNKLVDRVYSQLEAKLAWERRRYGF